MIGLEPRTMENFKDHIDELYAGGSDQGLSVKAANLA